MYRQVAFGVAVACILQLSACDTMFSTPPGITYAKDVEQLGIFPVYPPREDLQVGDVYAVEAHSEADRLKAKDAYADTINLSAQIQDYLKTRYVFGHTKTSGSGSTTTADIMQADTGSGKVISSSTLESLPITAFPDIQVETGLSVGAGGAGSSIAAAFGFSKTLNMELHFNLVTSYSVPIAEGIRQLAFFCGQNRPDECRSAYLANLINDRFELAGSDPKHIKRADVLLVTKVYLAREIDYTYDDATLAAAAAGTVAANGSTSVVTAATVNQAVANDRADVIEALAALQTSISTSTEAAAKAGNGGSVTLSAINGQSISFKQIFDRPVVVGYEGVNQPGT